MEQSETESDVTIRRDLVINVDIRDLSAGDYSSTNGASVVGDHCSAFGVAIVGDYCSASASRYDSRDAVPASASITGNYPVDCMKMTSTSCHRASVLHK